jgi:hypothetical protein
MDAIRSLKVEREIADYDRAGSVSRGAAGRIAKTVLAFLESQGR